MQIMLSGPKRHNNGVMSEEDSRFDSWHQEGNHVVILVYVPIIPFFSLLFINKQKNSLFWNICAQFCLQHNATSCSSLWNIWQLKSFIVVLKYHSIVAGTVPAVQLSFQFSLYLRVVSLKSYYWVFLSFAPKTQLLYSSNILDEGFLG